MEFGLSLEVDESLISKADWIEEVGSSLAEVISRGNYGAGVKKLVVGVILTKPDVTQLFAIRPPRFLKGKHSLEEDGIRIDVEDVVEIDIRPNYCSVRDARTRIDVVMSLAIALREGLRSISSLQIPAFSLERLQRDVDSFFQSTSTHD